MRVIALSRLRDFWQKHPLAALSLQSWYAIASRANWRTPSDVKLDYRHASPIAGNRVVFNIKGNDYRLIVAMHYDRGIAYIRFVGTHTEYDRIDATKV
jgi:mRNA interferase HigB